MIDYGWPFQFKRKGKSKTFSIWKLASRGKYVSTSDQTNKERHRCKDIIDSFFISLYYRYELKIAHTQTLTHMRNKQILFLQKQNELRLRKIKKNKSEVTSVLTRPCNRSIVQWSADRNSRVWLLICFSSDLTFAMWLRMFHCFGLVAKWVCAKNVHRKMKTTCLYLIMM